MVALARIVDEIYRPSCGFSRRNVEKWVERVSSAVGNTGLQVCDLKPLVELLGCEPEMGVILAVCIKNEEGLQQLGAQVKLLSAATRKPERFSDIEKRFAGQVAQALNWERTEFGTLDELLAAIREQEQHHSRFVDAAIRDRELLETVREKLCGILGAYPARQRELLDEVICLLGPKPITVGDMPSGFAEGGYVAEPPSGQVAAVLMPATHTLLHAGELYPGSTILLQTAQLVAWRDADGLEHCERAHRVTLDPDEDGLAAAILSRIAGVEIAPEHMAELRAQMAGGVK